MTALAPTSPATSPAARDTLSRYADRTGHGPVLGYLVVYSVYGGEITLSDATAQFEQMRLDKSILPGPLRADDAFLRVTGADGVRDYYNLDRLDTDATPAHLATTPAGPVRTASLMIRPVSRDSSSIVRHIVRELRDETTKTLSYKEHLGDVTFERRSGTHGAGQMVIRLDYTAVTALSAAEQTRVHALVQAVRDRYDWQCVYLGADRIRTLLLDYMRRLEAVPVRPSGGVYFVTSEHTATLEGLHDFVAGIGGHSMFARIPLADEAEMREMIIRSFTDNASNALKKLSMDIIEAQQKGVSHDKCKVLLDRFRALKHQTKRYSERLHTSLDETGSSLDLVEDQLTNLLQAR